MAGVPGLTVEQKKAALRADMRAGDSLMETSPGNWVIARAAPKRVRDTSRSGLREAGNALSNLGFLGDRRRALVGAASAWYGVDDQGNPELGRTPRRVYDALSLGALPATLIKGGQGWIAEKILPGIATDPEYLQLQEAMFPDPEWAVKAGEKVEQIDKAVHEDMNVPMPQTIGEHAEEAGGDVFSGIPLPAGTLPKLLGIGKAARKIRRATAPARKYIDPTVGVFTPTIDPTLVNYAGNTGAAAAMSYGWAQANKKGERDANEAYYTEMARRRPDFVDPYGMSSPELKAELRQKYEDQLAEQGYEDLDLAGGGSVPKYAKAGSIKGPKKTIRQKLADEGETKKLQESVKDYHTLLNHPKRPKRPAWQIMREFDQMAHSSMERIELEQAIKRKAAEELEKQGKKAHMEHPDIWEEGAVKLAKRRVEDAHDTKSEGLDEQVYVDGGSVQHFSKAGKVGKLLSDWASSHLTPGNVPKYRLAQKVGFNPRMSTAEYNLLQYQADVGSPHLSRSQYDEWLDIIDRHSVPVPENVAGDITTWRGLRLPKDATIDDYLKTTTGEHPAYTDLTEKGTYGYALHPAARHMTPAQYADIVVTGHPNILQITPAAGTKIFPNVPGIMNEVIYPPGHKMARVSEPWDKLISDSFFGFSGEPVIPAKGAQVLISKRRKPPRRTNFEEGGPVQGYSKAGSVSGNKLIRKYLERPRITKNVRNSSEYLKTVQRLMPPDSVPTKLEDLDLLDTYAEEAFNPRISADVDELLQRLGFYVPPDVPLYRGVGSADEDGRRIKEFNSLPPGKNIFVSPEEAKIMAATQSRSRAAHFAGMGSDKSGPGLLLKLNRDEPVKSFPLVTAAESEWVIPASPVKVLKRPRGFNSPASKEKSYYDVDVKYPHRPAKQDGGSVKDHCEGGMATISSMKRKYAGGGSTGGDPVQAITDALAHLDQGDSSAALQALQRSPQAMQDPGIQQALQGFAKGGMAIKKVVKKLRKDMSFEEQRANDALYYKRWLHRAVAEHGDNPFRVKGAEQEAWRQRGKIPHEDAVKIEEELLGGGPPHLTPTGLAKPTKKAKGGSVAKVVKRAAMTLAEAKKIVRGHGHTLVKEDGEYIVKKKGSKTRIEGDDPHYFTNDIEDAVGTSEAMTYPGGVRPKKFAKGGKIGKLVKGGPLGKPFNWNTPARQQVKKAVQAWEKAGGHETEPMEKLVSRLSKDLGAPETDVQNIIYEAYR